MPFWAGSFVRFGAAIHKKRIYAYFHELVYVNAFSRLLDAFLYGDLDEWIDGLIYLEAVILSNSVRGQ